ncbi:MAG: low molecular weight protein arginine phosphatase [Chloroflexota bacterium]
MYSVLFVCSANICRSPMAMGLLRASVREELSDWRIDSAGVWATNGFTAAFHTAQVLNTRGIDINAHRSQVITPALMAHYQLVLTMERNQKEALRAAFPRYAGRVHLLSELIGERFEVDDPMGRSLIEYEATARELESILAESLPKIRQLSLEPPAGQNG